LAKFAAYRFVAPDEDDELLEDPPDGRLDAPLEREAPDGGREEPLELGALTLGERCPEDLDGALTLGELRPADVDGDLAPELGREPELGRDGFEICGAERLPELEVGGLRTVDGGRLTVPLVPERFGCDEDGRGTTIGRLDVVDLPDVAGLPEVVVVGDDGDRSTAGGLYEVDGRRLVEGGDAAPDGFCGDAAGARTPEFEVGFGAARVEGLDWTTNGLR
jgi:hypothetical protein